MTSSFALDQPRGYVTDGGLETDLIFNHGVDLPEFAAFPLIESAGGRRLLSDYYWAYAEIAAMTGAGLFLETPTWRASPDWGQRLGYEADAIDRVNRDSVTFLRDLGREWSDDVAEIRVVGMVGPRGDGYRPGSMVSAAEAQVYHRPQVESLAGAGADIVTGYTMTTVGEATGIAQAAEQAGVPVAIAFTVETDGRLPDSTPLGDAVEQVDQAAPVAYFLINCAHPDHIAPAIVPGAPWLRRVVGLRVNASTLSHAELDEADHLDAGDPLRLARDQAKLEDRLAHVRVRGGCCGTDASHVAALWGVHRPAKVSRA